MGQAVVPAAETPREAPPALGRLCSALSVAVALGVSAYRVTAVPQWRDDAAALRALGPTPAGLEGAVSAVAGFLASVVPLGGKLLRLGLVACVATGVAALLVYGLTERLLARHGSTPRLTPLIAAVASLGTVLGPAWQSEGTIAGGAAVAAALALAATMLATDEAALGSAPTALYLGALGALCLLEQPMAALALVSVLVSVAVVRGHLPTVRTALLGLVGAVSAALPIVVARMLSALHPRSVLELGRELVPAATERLGAPLEPIEVLEAWRLELGLLPLVLALLGALFGLIVRRTRPWVIPLLLWPAADFVHSIASRRELDSDVQSPLRLLAIACAAAFAALGLHAASYFLLRAKVLLGKQAVAVLTVLYATTVFVRFDDSSTIAPRRNESVAGVLAHEVFDGLPPDALLLVRSEPIVQRLWAASAVEGARPDVVLVPVALLGRGAVAEHLLRIEPRLGPVIRDVAVRGEPSEFALSTLSDARPVHVEVDPSWDPRLLEHLLPHPYFMAFAPHAFGRSDRQRALPEVRAAFQRLAAAAGGEKWPDTRTLSALRHRMREQAATLGALGDREEALTLVGDLRAIDGQELAARELEARLQKKSRLKELLELMR
jgi:hypothetical protein